jgi:hypothetical protein
MERGPHITGVLKKADPNDPLKYDFLPATLWV